MTDTTVERQSPAPAMPDDLHEEVCDLIRALAATAGDANGAYDELRRYCSARSTEPAMAGLAAALIVTFTECITHPVEPGEFAELALPYDPTEGATTDV